MSWAPILAAGIGAAGSIFGGMQGSDAAEEALKFQKEVYGQTRKDLAPWRQTGEQALSQLWGYLQDPSKITEMPGYEFALGEGTKALLRSRAATGNLQSGATGKALTRYGQDYATTNFLNYLRPYQELSTGGQNAAARTGSLGASYAQSGANNILAGGGARVGAIGNVTNSILSGIKDYYYLSETGKLNNLFSNPQSNWKDTQYNYLAAVR